jgi:hypothetical protein
MVRPWTCVVTLALLLDFIALTAAQPPASQPDKDKLPAPGTTGNPDNAPFIGTNDPQGNPVRLAKSTGHVSNYSEDNVAPYTLPDPLVTSGKRLVTTAQSVATAFPSGALIIRWNFCSSAGLCSLLGIHRWHDYHTTALLF